MQEREGVEEGLLDGNNGESAASEITFVVVLCTIVAASGSLAYGFSVSILRHAYVVEWIDDACIQEWDINIIFFTYLYRYAYVHIFARTIELKMTVDLRPYCSWPQNSKEHARIASSLLKIILLF